jgi:hypothetical protein
MHNYQAVSLSSLPWADYGHDEYVANVKRCLVKVTLSSDIDKLLLLDHLEFRPKAGRTIVRNLAMFGLKIGDQLRAGGDIKNLQALDDIQTYPCICFFWRSHENFQLSSFCRLITVPCVNTGILGFTVESIALDMLHTVDQGVALRFIGVSLYALLDSEAHHCKRRGQHLPTSNCIGQPCETVESIRPHSVSSMGK